MQKFYVDSWVCVRVGVYVMSNLCNVRLRQGVVMSPCMASYCIYESSGAGGEWLGAWEREKKEKKRKNIYSNEAHLML